jgi:hypothetical protein
MVTVVIESLKTDTPTTDHDIIIIPVQRYHEASRSLFHFQRRSLVGGSSN